MSRFLTASEILAVHDQVIERWGGSHGVRDPHLLDSAIGAPQHSFGGKLLHPTLTLQAAALLRSLVRNHPFVDGNKRTAFLATFVFLEMNGFVLEAPDADAVKFTLSVATRSGVKLESIQAWIERHRKKAG